LSGLRVGLGVHMDAFWGGSPFPPPEWGVFLGGAGPPPPPAHGAHTLTLLVWPVVVVKLYDSLATLEPTVIRTTRPVVCLHAFSVRPLCLYVICEVLQSPRPTSLYE